MKKTAQFLFGLIFFVSAAVATSATAEKRLALVIGNGDYLYTTPLVNPVNDARAISSKLESLGFETYVGYDLDKFGMEKLLRDFARASRKSDMNLLFYAGHGMSVDGENYLIPVDAAFEDETALDFEAVPVSFVTRQLTLSNAVNLVLLDACRDNPLSRSLSRSMGATRSNAVSTGLSEMKIANPGKGMAIAFATSPGEVALDGEDQNSPFTTALLRHIDAENTDITEVFTRVTGDVYKATDEAQRPWLNVSLTGPVILNPVTRMIETSDASSTTGEVTQSSGTMLEEQKLLFQLARDTGDVDDYKSYLESFPNGLYANNARRAIRKLESEGGTDVATLSTRNSSVSSSGPEINEIGPLVLPVTSTMRVMPSSEATEKELGLDRTLKGNIQARLNAVGHNVGGVDGQWGPKTRTGIRNWQAAHGLNPNGYLNKMQYQLLVSQSEGLYTPYTAPVARVSSSSGNRTKTKPTQGTRRNNNNAIGAAILGVAIGTILSK